jgi:tRNA(adenine34) deaminase
MKNKFLELALNEAKLAYNKDEVPVGAVVIHNGEVIASAHNLRETSNSATAHAEILAIEKACRVLGNWKLTDCDLYVTLEPCIMCAGAIINARIRRS